MLSVPTFFCLQYSESNDKYSESNENYFERNVYYFRMKIVVNVLCVPAFFFIESFVLASNLDVVVVATDIFYTLPF